MSTTDSFKARVYSAIKGKYEPYMRRSLQSVALYEANRCLEARYSQLRPFQKKYALFATAVELLKSLDYLTFVQRQAILFRTKSSREPLEPNLAWNRMKPIAREIGTSILTAGYREVIESDENKDKSHDEICDLLLQKMYDESKENDETDKPHHKEWEYSHSNLFLVYRIYYKGVDLDPDIFAAVPPTMVSVPLKKPADFRLSASYAGINLPPAVELSDEDRRAMLKEVKDHTELLASFVGVIPDEELLKRKKRLYAALPQVPLPATGGEVAGGKQKKKKKAKEVAPAEVAPAEPAKDDESEKAKEESTAMEEEEPETAQEEVDVAAV